MKTKEEIEILRADAAAGDAFAQNELGCAYSSGNGVAIDQKEAFLWFERSAKLGYKYGQYNVGLYYHNGWGTRSNIQLAIEWYEKAAEQGFAKAANMLGCIYENGYTGIPENHAEAFYWYNRGSLQDENAKYNLARCYEEGKGTSVSLYKACALYKECKGEDAKKRLDKIEETYNPLLDTRSRSIDIIGNNPFRVLGGWSNSSERDIRANKSKLDVMAKIGKYANIENDRLIPSTIADYIVSYKNRIAYLEGLIEKSQDLESDKEFGGLSVETSYSHGIRATQEDLKSLQKKLSESKNPNERAQIRRKMQDAQRTLEGFKRYLYREIHGKVEVYRGILLDYERAAQRQASWSDLPSRTLENINSSAQKITSEKERVKYALFWFCNYTPSDAKALSFMLEHKLDEAYEEWCNVTNFSAIINKSLILWLERKDKKAIKNIHKIITDDTLRAEFVSAVTSGRTEMTEEELSALFWDALYDFPESELSVSDIMWYGSDKNILNINEGEKYYIQNKGYNILKSPIDDLLRKAGSLDENDFEKARSIYYEVIEEAPNILSRIKRALGEEDYRYKLFSNKIAVELLKFAIHYNNDKTGDYLAPNTALHIASAALNIAIDDNLRERCKKNVDIFRRNIEILSANKHFEEKLPKQNRRLQLQKNKQFSTYTETKVEKRARRTHKIYTTIIVSFVLAAMWYYMNWNNNLKYFMEAMPWWGYSCISFMVLVGIFPIIMWGMEFQKDPYNTKFYWLDKCVEGPFVLSNYILAEGVQEDSRETYSWPLAFPFALLGIAIGLLSLPIKGMAKLAAMIK